MDTFSMIYLICTVASIPAGMLALTHFFTSKKYMLGVGWLDDKKPDSMDWVLAFSLTFLICLPAWPVLVTYAAVTSIGTKEARKEEKRKKKARKQAKAFKQMREARKCISQAKHDAYRLDTKQWELDFHEADTKDRTKREAEHRRLLAARIAERNAERIERERTYAAAKGYSSIYCPHGNSYDYPCSHCF